MPRVPSYDDFQVTPNTLPQVYLRGPDVPDVAGAQLRQQGAAMSRFGGEMGQIAQDMQAQADQLRVDDALNQIKETALRLTHDKDGGFLNLKGIDALQRASGKPLEAEYGDKLQEHVAKVSGTLGNDRQRQMFARHSNDIVTALRGSAMQHEAGEFKTYGLSVSEGVQATALRDIGLNWNNPDAVNSAVDRIRAEVYRQGKLLGKSAEWQEAQARKLTSNGHKVALFAALEQNDAGYADAYLRKYSPQMDADDILAVKGHITKAVDAQVGVSVASSVIREVQPRIQPGDAERAFNIAVQTESGGQQFDAKGQPLTSKAGAVGIAQVMPATGPEAAKLSGLPWDETRYKNDANYNKALGLAYFQKQLQDNGGDLAKAYAAYNAGPGRLQQGIKLAEAANANPQNDGRKTWLDFMPDETKAYVAKNLKAYDAGQGQPTRPTFQEIDDRLRADPRLASSPARYKIARDEAQRQFDEQTKAIKQREDDAFANALRTGIAGGYRYSAIPVSLLAAVPPDKLDSLRNSLSSLAKGDNVDSPVAYQKLTSNPAFLKGMSESEWFVYGTTNLSQETKKHFDNERAKLTGGGAGQNGPGDLNASAIKQALDERLRVLKIDPSPKDDGGNDAARIGGIRKFVNEYFLSAQREAGKKFTDAEVAQHLDVLFAKNATLRGWFSDSSGPMLSMKAGDVPNEEKKAIKEAYKRAGVSDPTDAQIIDLYWKRQLYRK